MKIPDRPRCCELRYTCPGNTPATVCIKHDGKASGQKQVRRPAIHANARAFGGLKAANAHICLLYCEDTGDGRGASTRLCMMWPQGGGDAGIPFEGSAERILPVFFLLAGQRKSQAGVPVTRNYKY